MSEELENIEDTPKKAKKTAETKAVDFFADLSKEQQQSINKTLPKRIKPGFFLIRRTNQKSKQISYIEKKKNGQEMNLPAFTNADTFSFELAIQNIEQEKQNLARMVFAGVTTL